METLQNNFYSVNHYAIIKQVIYSALRSFFNEPVSLLVQRLANHGGDRALGPASVCFYNCTIQVRIEIEKSSLCYELKP